MIIVYTRQHTPSMPILSLSWRLVAAYELRHSHPTPVAMTGGNSVRSTITMFPCQRIPIGNYYGVDLLQRDACTHHTHTLKSGQHTVGYHR